MGFLSESSRSDRATASRGDRASLPLQAKLRKGRRGDAYEQEADRVADRVLSGAEGPAPLADSIRPFVQRQVGPEEEEPVRRQPEEEEPVQAQVEAEREEEPVQLQVEAEREEESVQAQVEEEGEQPVAQAEEDRPEAPGARSPALTDPEIERRLRASKSGGRPLGPEIRTEMEARFGTGLGHVRVHTDRQAVELSRQLGARAFTHGNHIYFDDGRYAPATLEGKRLIAHELTHVLQQTDRIERETVRRQAEDRTADGEKKTRFEAGGVVLDTEKTSDEDDRSEASLATLTIPSLEVPKFKKRHEASWNAAAPHVVRRTGRGKTDQVPKWRATVSGEAGSFLDMEAAESKGALTKEGKYFFRGKEGRNEKFYLFGTKTELEERLVIPTWDHQADPRTFQVDHIVEDQLGGEDEVSNYELLDATANVSAGPTLSASIDRAIRGALEKLGGKYPDDPDVPPKSQAADVRKNYRVKFASHSFESDVSGDEDRFWLIGDFVDVVDQDVVDQRGDVQSPIEPLRPMMGEEVEGLGEDGKTVFFVSATGGEMVPKPAEGEELFERVFFVEWRPENEAEPGEKAGVLVVDAYKSAAYEKKEKAEKEQGDGGVTIDPSYQHQEWDIVKIAGLYGGFIDRESVRWWVRRSLSLPGLSPIALETVRLDARKGIVGRGKLAPTVPLVRDADIDVYIEGADVQLRKTFEVTEIDVPPPFTIRDTSLSVFWGKQSGLGVEGRTHFEIQHVGDGHLQAAASVGAGFELEGEFNFDSDLFDPAKVEMTYRDEVLGVTGVIGIKKGTVRGVESASIEVAYSEGELSAEGRAKLAVPGIEEGTMSVNYSEEGWSIGGSFSLSNDVPGIKSGSVEATVSKTGDENGYGLKAAGTAVPDLPGITSELDIEYEDGAIDVHGRAAYERGLLSGEIDVGATNRGLDTDGNPTGDPTDILVVYGGGSLTMQITPWLEGAVGVRYHPNGEMVVSGEIGLPDTLDVFDRIEIPERELYGVGFDIPIFAIPVGPKSIGLKATIRGGLRAYAGIGPGRLEGLELSVEYNPDRVEETHVQGAGRFVIPADAGLKLAVRATVGLDAFIGGVEGGLELAGGLGVEAAAEAGVEIDWMPTSGFEMRASLAAYVQPKFIFNIDGVITAWFAWYEKEWRWRLADYEYGSNMRFGVRLPIVYREGEPFDVSFDDLEIERPDIDARSLLRGLIGDVRDKRG